MSKFDKLTEAYIKVVEGHSFDPLPKGYKPKGVPLEEMNDMLLHAIREKFRSAGSGNEVQAVKSGPDTIFVRVIDANIKLIQGKEVITQEYQIKIEPYKK